MVTLSLVDGGSSVAIGFDELTTAQRSEIEYQLMLAGATTGLRGLRLTAFTFRRAAPEVARVLRRTGAQVQWDPGVEELLRIQLEEIRARRAAETTPSLTSDQVEAAVRLTGRFTRTLTARQQTEPRAGFLSTTHGANFSVPGSWQETTLLATYEALRGRSELTACWLLRPNNAFVSWEDELAECYARASPTLCRAGGGRRGVIGRLGL